MQKQVKLGIRVWAEDGEVGTVEKIVVDPKKHQPGYLVVKWGRVRARQIVVPASLVTDVLDEVVTLATTRQALKTFPDYEITVEKPEPQDDTSPWSNIPPLMRPWIERGTIKIRQRTVPEHTVDLKRGMTVYDQAGIKLGQIEGVIADAEKQQVSHVILHRLQTLLLDEYRLVPIDLVDFVIRSDVYLRITKDHTYGLPIYHPNQEATVD